MALSKTQCLFIIFEAGFPAPVPKPRVRMGSLCRGGRAAYPALARSAPGEQGCFLGATLL